MRRRMDEIHLLKCKAPRLQTELELLLCPRITGGPLTSLTWNDGLPSRKNGFGLLSVLLGSSYFLWQCSCACCGETSINPQSLLRSSLWSLCLARSVRPPFLPTALMWLFPMTTG